MYIYIMQKPLLPLQISTSAANPAETDAGMYVCMHVCMYVCMYDVYV